MLKIFRAIVFLAIINLPLYGAIIRAGHVINIQVMSNPEFSGQYIVNENGTIEYPIPSRSDHNKHNHIRTDE